jgi:chromosome segregation ATPase
MARKRLADLLQEEAQKPAPTLEESTIEVTATSVDDNAKEVETKEETNAALGEVQEAIVDFEAIVKELKATLKEAEKKEAALQEKSDELEATVKELKATLKQTQKKEAALQETSDDLEATVKELKATLKQTQKKETALQEKNLDLESSLEKLTKELHQAKQDAVHLAQTNTQLMEESRVYKEPAPKEAPKQITTYRKSSYALSRKLAPTQPHNQTEDSDEENNSSNQMWLLD